jgi:hypothetical protein
VHTPKLTRTPKMVLVGLAAAAALTAVGASVGTVQATSLAAAAPALSASPGQLVTIDAKTDPTDALDALKLYEDATDRSFTPTTDPTFAQTKWSPVTDLNGTPAPSVTGNAQTGQAVTERLDVKHENSASWSIGGSVENSIGFDLAGIVDVELSMKFTASHTWESSTTDSEGIWVTALPGKTVWIEAANSTATFTGNFAFTSDGVRYLVNNVTITQPASPDTDTMTSTTYRVMEVNSASLGLPRDTTGGFTPLQELPKLQKLIGSGH